MAGSASSPPDPFLKNALAKSRRENALLQDRIRELEDSVASLRRTVLVLTTNGTNVPLSNSQIISPQVLRSIYERTTSGISSAASVGYSTKSAFASGNAAGPNSLEAAADPRAGKGAVEALPTRPIAASGLPSSHVATVDGLPPISMPPLAPASFACAESQVRVGGSVAMSSSGHGAGANGIGSGFVHFIERLDLKAHNGAVYAIRFSPDGTKLVSSSFDRSLAVWAMDNYISSASSNPLLTIPEAHRGPIVAVEWMRDSSRVITGAFDASAAEWDVSNGQVVPVSRFFARGLVYAVTASPCNGNVFFVGTGRKAVHMFDCRVHSKSQHLNQTPGVLSEGHATTASQAASLSAAARGPSDESSVILENDSAVYSIHADFDGNHILTGDQGGAIKTWDLRTIGQRITAVASKDGGAALQQTTYNDADHRPITHVHCSPPVAGVDYGRLVAVNSYDTFLRIYDRGASLFGSATSELKLLHSLRGVVNRNWPIKSAFFVGRDYRPPRAGGRRQPRGREGLCRQQPMEHADSSLDPKLFKSTASASMANAPDGNRRYQRETAASSHSRAASTEFDSDLEGNQEETFDSSSEEDDDRGNHLQRLGGQYKPLQMPIQAALILASGSADGSILIYDVGGGPGTGGVVQAIRGHRDRVHSVDFHPSEPILASCSADGQIKIWAAPARH
jgi:WD40 repeat protein